MHRAAAAGGAGVVVAWIGSVEPWTREIAVGGCYCDAAPICKRHTFPANIYTYSSSSYTFTEP